MNFHSLKKSECGFLRISGNFTLSAKVQGRVKWSIKAPANKSGNDSGSEWEGSSSAEGSTTDTDSDDVPIGKSQVKLTPPPSFVQSRQA